MTETALSHNLFQVPSGFKFRDAAAAIIYLDDGRYLMQHRDDKPGIFYPDHWGLFGGAMELGENAETALRRELKEEIDLDVSELRHFTRMNFGFDVLGIAATTRDFYEVRLASATLAGLRLGEGQSMQPLTLTEILLEMRVVPYDSFAIWMHYAWRQQGSPAHKAKQN